jgi:DtxR family Mn-dependent transcriptional regulator
MTTRDIEEHLEILWGLSEKQMMDRESLRKQVEERGEYNDDIIETLELEGYVRLENSSIRFTNEGEDKARKIIRSHRLAERFMVDALGLKSHKIEAGACEFEHFLNPEIVDSICTFLGHPRKCPHNRQIPEGRCCKEKTDIIHCGIIPLDKARAGEKYKVAYINTSHSRMHKLSHYGIKPGSQICLDQGYPAFVISTENERVAIETDIAKEICLWKNSDG